MALNLNRNVHLMLSLSFSIGFFFKFNAAIIASSTLSAAPRFLFGAGVVGGWDSKHKAFGGGENALGAGGDILDAGVEGLIEGIWKFDEVVRLEMASFKK